MKLSKVIFEKSDGYKKLVIIVVVEYNIIDSTIENEYRVFEESYIYINNGNSLKLLCEAEITEFLMDDYAIAVAMDRKVNEIDWREIYRNKMSEEGEAL